MTSLQVAEAFGKEHFNVLRDIETILLQVPENFRKLNFEVSEYTIQNPLTGGELPKPMYLLTKDADHRPLLSCLDEHPTRHSPENIASGLEHVHRAGNASFPLPLA